MIFLDILSPKNKKKDLPTRNLGKPTKTHEFPTKNTTKYCGQIKACKPLKNKIGLQLHFR
jgi:hypothetical protein